jgi:hypothetical protein
MEQNQMLEFVKALGHADRLRVVGVLTKAPASIKQVAEALNIPFRDAMNHLAYLEHIGAVRAQPAENRQDAIYELAENSLENLARKQFEGQKKTFEPSPDLDEKSRKVLKAYLNADGSIRELPINQAPKLQVILNYLLQFFSTGVIYTEKEVNTILRRYNEDVAGLRRDLIDRGMLERKSDGSQYWRPAPTNPADGTKGVQHVP